eukprot:scaffold65618_cov60-Phaeocystis_antarctica.AAC.5
MSGTDRAPCLQHNRTLRTLPAANQRTAGGRLQVERALLVLLVLGELDLLLEAVDVEPALPQRVERRGEELTEDQLLAGGARLEQLTEQRVAHRL